MDHFPIFLALKDQRVLLSGGGEAALAKLRLLMKSTADLHVFTRKPAQEISLWAAQGKLNLHKRAFHQTDLKGVKLVYAADEDDALDARTAQLISFSMSSITLMPAPSLPPLLLIVIP